MDVEALPLPDAFVNFLKENGLDPSIYISGDSVPRYIRVKPGFEGHVEEIADEIKCKLHRVSWLPNFYYLPPEVRIASSKAYKEGKIYGIDAASGAAVTALGIHPGDHVLDLCAAPGAKLCMILELLGNSGSVTGLDIAKHRLAACRTLLQKYSLGDHCRLFVADGSKFSLTPIRNLSNSRIDGEYNSDKRIEVYQGWTSRIPYKERKRAIKAKEYNASQLDSPAEGPELIYYGRHSGVVGLSKREVYQVLNQSDAIKYGYDKVLVDAECTHDGSIKHIQKFEQWGWTTLERRVLDADRTNDLSILQLQLLTNGFKLLKVGGSLVYSTCSLTVAQNEDVVQHFLSQNPTADLLDIDAASNWPCKLGGIPKTLRFDPLTSSTSGLFIAKFTKQGI
ncbi:RNA methyltransferase [Lithospermum erythrorhizon]|uniref:RNA methyltransferase n=1 Tax=Lithospermum erythrorhizon TaxID=34254 RepID=A0AAV3Q6E6_LITER